LQRLFLRIGRKAQSSAGKLLNLRSAVEHRLLCASLRDLEIEEAEMRLLMPIGALLIAIGAAGGTASCFGTGIFDGAETETAAARMDGMTDAPAEESDDSSPRLFLAPLSGLTLAIGLVCVAIGMGKWRRPIPSDVRPANPWSDQSREHGDPPRGLV
jgi:hypothetical protein